MQLTVQLPPIQFVVGHAEGGSGVDPVAGPAGGAEFGVDGGGVVAALGGDDDFAAGEGCEVEGVLEGGFVLGLGRGRAAGVARAEEQRFDEVEIAFGGHAVHQNGPNHAAPANQSYKSPGDHPFYSTECGVLIRYSEC